MSKKIWTTDPNLDTLNSLCANTAPEHLGIQITDFGDDHLTATMPVDSRTVQPMRILHGGSSVLLAETVGSIASALCLPSLQKTTVGVSINAHHLSPAHEGSTVTATARPIRIGRKLHVWNIDIHDQNHRQICTCQLTMAIIDQP